MSTTAFFFVYGPPGFVIAALVAFAIILAARHVIVSAIRAKREKRDLEASLKEQLRRQELAARDPFNKWDAEEKRKRLTGA